MDMVQTLYQRYLAQETNDDEVLQLWRIVTLALWLRHLKVET
jgi:hypothetical protein